MLNDKFKERLFFLFLYWISRIAPKEHFKLGASFRVHYTNKRNIEIKFKEE